MRDKQAVEAYKAGIKAQLSRAGLIRGQPRCSFVCPSSDPLIPPQSSPPPSHLPGPSNTSPVHPFDVPKRPNTYLDPLHRNQNHHGCAQSTLSPLPPFQMPDYHDPTFYPIQIQNQYVQYSQSTALSESLSHDVPHPGSSQDLRPINFDVGNSPPPLSSFPATQNSIQEHIIYYFEHVRKAQFVFAGTAFTNATYSAVVQDSGSAVTNAVCAMANLHFARKRIVDNIDPPDPNLENCFALRFHEEACRQLENARRSRPLVEADALAAFHLICFSQFSGGVTPWQPAFQVMSDWLSTTGLINSERPALCFRSLNSTAQFLVNSTLWIDIIISIVHARSPKYIGLSKSLVTAQGECWTSLSDMDKLPGLGMDHVSGCPDSVMLALAEIASLAHWKAAEQRKDKLSYKELVGRGDSIEERLLRNYSDADRPNQNDLDFQHLNVRLLGTTDEGVLFPSDNSRSLAASLFREAAALLLNTVISGTNPGVPEIQESVNRITQLLRESVAQLEVDRAFVFPIFLAGSLSEDGTHRDLYQARFRKLDRTVGNVSQIQFAMESVWRKRHVTRAAVDFGESLREQNFNLLLM